MATITCRCNKIIELRSFPNPHTFYYLSDRQLLDFIDNNLASLIEAVKTEKLSLTGDASHSHLAGEVLGALYKAMSDFVKCPSCGRLIFFPEESGVRQHYVPEDGEGTSRFGDGDA
jgi:hypothetical protein